MSPLSVASDIRTLEGRLDRVARGGRSAFKSDLDVVIRGNPVRVEALAQRVNAVANRFGGYGFAAGPWKIDFWALRNTWAAKAGHVKVNDFSDVVHCTFFDWDAVIYDLTRRRVVCDKDYLERIRSRKLEISLRQNPGELGNLLRAARRLVRWRLVAGPLLKSFIIENLNDHTFFVMKATERRKYADRVLDTFSNAAHLRSALLKPDYRHDDRAAQMDLPLEED